MTPLLCKICTYYNHKTKECIPFKEKAEAVRQDPKKCGAKAVCFSKAFGKDGLAEYIKFIKTTDY